MKKFLTSISPLPSRGENEGEGKYFFCDSDSKTIDLRHQAREGKRPEMTLRQRFGHELSRTVWQLAEDLALFEYAKEFQESEAGLIPFVRIV
jgi:hypothetical protein